MMGMVCVREDLFNGLGSEESADHRTSSACGGSEGRRKINEVPFHMGSSIAGHFHSSRMGRFCFSRFDGLTVLCHGLSRGRRVKKLRTIAGGEGAGRRETPDATGYRERSGWLEIRSLPRYHRGPKRWRSMMARQF